MNTNSAEQTQELAFKFAHAWLTGQVPEVNGYAYPSAHSNPESVLTDSFVVAMSLFAADAVTAALRQERERIKEAFLYKTKYEFSEHGNTQFVKLADLLAAIGDDSKGTTDDD